MSDDQTIAASDPVLHHRPAAPDPSTSTTARPKGRSLITREAFRTSRLLDFASQRELTAQIGPEPVDWPLVLLKELVVYADPDGSRSSAGERLYMILTRMIYKPFGLNKEQMAARLRGENYRDTLDDLTLLFLAQLEHAVAAVIWAGIEARQRRVVIRANIRQQRDEIAKVWQGVIRTAKETTR